LHGQQNIFLIVLILAAFSDFLDGYVARRMGSDSNNGAVVDAFADKVLIMSLLIAFVFAHYVSVYYLVLLLARDIVVIGGLVVLSFFKISSMSHIPHSISGKITTGLQFIAILLLVFHIVPPILFYLTAIIGIYASVGYIMLGASLAKIKN
jgi:CDP-diacylglycerol--glycerol-3-phosphate 3-phosphatidyltransferase